MSWLRPNRLWIQLSVAFAGLIILSTFIVAALGIVLRPDPVVRTFPDTEEFRALPQHEQEMLVRIRFERYRSRALLVTFVVSGVLGVSAGVWMSRRLTAPLDDVVEGAHAIGARDLSRRVPVRGSQEIRTVAHAFNEMAAALESAETQRQNLLADVAHELRTPLTVVQGNLRAILDDVYTLDKSEVARLYDQTRHLIALVNDLHELAQAEARRLPLHRAAVDLVDLARTAVEFLEPVAEAEGVTLITDLPTNSPTGSPAEPLVVQADKARLLQVLQNLLANALRHTSGTGGTAARSGEIRLRVAASGSEAEISVQDNGDGIDPVHLPHIFDRFYRTDRARARDSGGAGLGLALVRAIIEAHDGRVEADSAGLGQGSRFSIYLPLSANAPATTSAQAAPSSRESADTTRRSAPAKARRFPPDS